jgi:hypothetical protein
MGDGSRHQNELAIGQLIFVDCAGGCFPGMKLQICPPVLTGVNPSGRSSLFLFIAYNLIIGTFRQGQYTKAFQTTGAHLKGEWWAATGHPSA